MKEKVQLPGTGQDIRVGNLLEPIGGPELMTRVDLVGSPVDVVNRGGQTLGALSRRQGGQAEKRDEGDGELHLECAIRCFDGSWEILFG